MLRWVYDICLYQVSCGLGPVVHELPHQADKWLPGLVEIFSIELRKFTLLSGYYIHAGNLTVEAVFSISNLAKVGQGVPGLIQLMDTHMQLWKERGSVCKQPSYCCQQMYMPASHLRKSHVEFSVSAILCSPCSSLGGWGRRGVGFRNWGKFVMYWNTQGPSGTIREQKSVRCGGDKRQLKVEEGVSE